MEGGEGWWGEEGNGSVAGARGLASRAVRRERAGESAARTSLTPVVLGLPAPVEQGGLGGGFVVRQGALGTPWSELAGTRSTWADCAAA